MIVEPVPTAARSRRRRALGRVGLALPPLLLVLVVVGGMAGRPASRQPAPRAADPAATPAATARVVAPDDGVVLDPGFPKAVDDLAVRTVPDVLAARAGGERTGLVAVAGYLSLPQLPADCGESVSGPLGPIGPLCEHRALLTAAPGPTGGTQPVRRGPHLHVAVPVGVRLPKAIARTLPAVAGPPLPAVLVGWFGPPPEGGCQAAGFRCDEGFRAESVAWADGASFPARPVIDAGVDVNPTEWVMRSRETAEIGAVGSAGRVFVSALVRPTTLARIDPAAAAAVGELRSARAPRGLVWYVRGLASVSDPPRYPLGPSRVLRWIVLDDVTGVTIARGAEPQAAP